MPLYVRDENGPFFVVPTYTFDVHMDINVTRRCMFIQLIQAFAFITGALVFLGVFQIGNNNGNSLMLLKPNLTVAQDGSGDYTTISAAVAAAPSFSTQLFRIYIKSGVYRERVKVGQNKTNIVFIGDGIGKTVITFNRNTDHAVNRKSTLNSATVVVRGFGFVAQHMTFENSAGPNRGETVALLSESNHSAFYKCSFLGYQATLYARWHSQFYRDCDIYGSIDFIFGNAAAVFQNCKIYAQRRSDGQSISITAQGRSSPSIENYGFSIHNCIIAATPDPALMRLPLKAYLGCPRRAYSTVVIMQSSLGDLIDPAGWLDSDGRSALNKLYYGEFNNTGPGADTARRVKWPGYHIINSQAEANNFTVKAFIKGDKWIPRTGIPFIPGLI